MPRQRQNKKIVIGVTGSFGSGKSTVAGIFKRYGASVIDADKLARGCVHPGSPAYKRVISLFGRDILARGRSIDRSRLAGIVFNNKSLLRKLNSIIHPEVIRNIRQRIKTAKSKIVLLDAPLIIEAGLRNIVDKLIVVKVSRKKQIKRIQKRLGISKSVILKRIRCQMPQKEKVRFADFIIDNDGTLNQTKKQVERIWRRLWKSWKSSI
jgi:dephospho-CoA kinase